MVDDDLGAVLDKLQQERAEDLKNQGNQFYKQGNFDEALSCYDKALGIVPDSPEILNNRGMALVRLGRIDEAKLCREKITELKSREDFKSRREANPSTQTNGKYIRNPLVALTLSFFMPGWGQWYNGRTWDGLKFFGIVAVLSIAAIFTRLIFGPFGFMFSLLGFVFVIIGMLDAYQGAEKINHHELEFNGKSRLFWLPVVLIIIVMVILLAILMFFTFIFLTPPNVSPAKQLMVTAQSDQNGLITIQNAGGRDAGQVLFVNVSLDGVELPSRLTSVIGSTVTAQGLTGQPNRVMATATFKDGTQQLVLDTYIYRPITRTATPSVPTAVYPTVSSTTPVSPAPPNNTAQNTGTLKPKFKWGDVIQGTVYSSEYYYGRFGNFIVTNDNPEDSGHYILHNIYDCPNPPAIIVNVADVDNRFTKIGNQHPDTVCDGLPMNTVQRTSSIYYT